MVRVVDFMARIAACLLMVLIDPLSNSGRYAVTMVREMVFDISADFDN